MAVQDLTNYDFEDALSEVEKEGEYQSQGEAFDIIVKHGNSLNNTTFYITGDNYLIQAYEGTAKELGFKKDSSRAVFVNEKTGKTTAESDMTLTEFGIGANDVLTIFPDGKVAAK